MSDSLISKIWNFCHTLRDDGLSYGEYLEQLTFMLFLKMADEYAKPPCNWDTHIPNAYNWQSQVKDNQLLQAFFQQSSNKEVQFSLQLNRLCIQ
jgi:type I restriction enzyme M protein